MVSILVAVFDGEVLRPEGHVDLKLNTRYRVIIEQEVEEVASTNTWDILDAMTGTVQGPTDWAKEHDHYLYNTPKRHGGSQT
jgi:hypothetical protein